MACLDAHDDDFREGQPGLRCRRQRCFEPVGRPAPPEQAGWIPFLCPPWRSSEANRSPRTYRRVALAALVPAPGLSAAEITRMVAVFASL